MRGLNLNFYKHYIGDYARDTTHLTLMEHGAYRVMLDTYYATEKPLPGDLPSLYRICKAFSQAEKRAVEMVAKNFFSPSDDGLRHNQRADQEIAEANAYAHAQAMRAHKRWHKPGSCPTGAESEPRQCPDDASHSHSHKKTTTAGKPANSAPPEFDAFWTAYPFRGGGNPRVKALKAYRARLADGHTPEEMISGVRRYADFIRETGKEGTEYVLQAATFLGPDKRFLEEWALPTDSASPLYSRESVM